MSRRNFILLVIVLVIVTLGVLGFLYMRSGGPGQGDDVGEGTNFFSRFNLFGRGDQSDTNTPDDDVIDLSGFDPSIAEEMRRMRKISSMPVAGYGVFQKERYKEMLPPVVSEEEASEDEIIEKVTPPETEFASAVRYVERSTGNVYQTFVDEIDERRFTTTIIPQIYEAFIGNKGTTVVMRYLKSNAKTIETFVANLPKEVLGEDKAEENEISGFFLPENVRDISISPDTTKIFYLFNFGDGIVGTVMNLIDSKKTQVFDSAFTQWLSSWSGNRSVILSTKPARRIPGYVYSIEINRRNFVKTFGGINGLTARPSHDGGLILYGNDGLSLSMYDTSSKTMNSLSTRTMPEKCVWAESNKLIYCAVPKTVPAGEYPDMWYQGEVSFNDQFWKIDLESGNASIILDPVAEAGLEVDGVKLALDDSEKFLLFVNKKDSSLWVMDLE